MTRTTAREVALQIVFELGFSSFADPDSVAFRMSDSGFELLADEGGLFKFPVAGEQREYIESIVRGILERMPELDALIEKYSEGWSVTRVSKMAKAVLRLCLYEIKYGGTPAAIAINEAVELSKKFDADESAPSFINGILGSVVRENDES